MHRIWAVARTTILMAFRKRAPLVLVLFLVIGAPLLSLFLEGDNTLLGLLRLTVTYNFMLMSALMMFLVIYLSATVLDADLRGKQIYVVDAKPVRRWELLAGKWLGVMLLSGWLLLVMGTATYLLLLYLARPTWKRPDDLLEAKQQFLVARASFRPLLPNIDREIRRYKEMLKAQGRLDEAEWDPAELRREIRRILNKKLMPIPYQAARTFEFRGLPRETDLANEQITVRYTLHGNRGGASAGWLTHEWLLAHPGSEIVYQEIAKSKSGTTREFQKSARAVGPAGRLDITLVNHSGPEGEQPPAVINVPLDNGLEVLAPVGSFGGNFLRALLLLWIRLAMIAAIGIAANTFLGGAVTAFLLVGVLITGMLNSFVYGIVSPAPTSLAQKKPEGVVEMAKGALATGLRILPDFSETDPVEDLYVGRVISTGRLIVQTIADLCLRAGVWVAAGLLVFPRREIGLPYR